MCTCVAVSIAYVSECGPGNSVIPQYGANSLPAMLALSFSFPNWLLLIVAL